MECNYRKREGENNYPMKFNESYLLLFTAYKFMVRKVIMVVSKFVMMLLLGTNFDVVLLTVFLSLLF